MKAVTRLGRLTTLGAAVGLMAACAGPTEPLSPSLVVFSAGEAELVICKSSATAGNFDYSWSIASTAGSSVALSVNGTVTALAAGDCVLAYTVPTTNGGRYRATVTEGPLLAHWSLTGIVATFSLPNPPAVLPVVDLSARSISNVFMANDVGATVTFTNLYTPPPTGCTLTQGYWKTHSEFGPAPYDANWANLANGASTPFFLSGASWIQVFGTAPAGNAYYNLAHQYMAAVLNGHNGASQSAVQTALTTSASLFGTYTPAQIGALKGSNALRQQFVALAGTLDAYNNGLTGPGHCPE